MSKIFWFFVGMVLGWVIIGVMFPNVGEYMMSESFLPAVIDTVKGWFIK